MADLPEHSTPSRLPGVGDRLDVTDTEGSPVRIIRRRTGHVELHADGVLVELDPVAASTVGAFVSGHFRLPPAVTDRLADVLGGLEFDWVRLEPGDAAVGRTIEELGVRRRTGVTIVAVLRGSIPIVAPDPSIRLEGNDDLVIACRPQDRDRFARFVTKGV